MKHDNLVKTLTRYGFKTLLTGCFAFLLTFNSCDYLDVVPDNIPTIEHAFRNRTEAQKYLYGCLWFLPNVGNMVQDPAMLGGDEIWVSEDLATGTSSILRRIALGEQGTVSPYASYWASRRNTQTNVAKPLWTGISDCNIFLENIDKPFDLSESERLKWTGEVLFVKAYLHYWLLRQYGPIPIMKKNQPIDAGAELVQQHREPVDTVVNYIVSLLDEAARLLPLSVEDPASEMGRPDKCIALALKAQLLTLAASPLFNCNPDYAEYIDNRGLQLFPQDESAKKVKWQRAADALKEAIDIAHEGLHQLYDFRTAYATGTSLSEETILAMQVRGAATERWNTEIIWGNSRTDNHTSLQRMCMPYFTTSHAMGGGGNKNYAPPLGIVEQFFTKNGLPIEDDKDWEEKDLWALRTATADDRQYIRQGYTTIELHFEREARFYGSIAFDGGTYYGNSRLNQDNTTNSNYMWITEMKMGQLNGMSAQNRSTMTGYFCKKMSHYRSSIADASTSGITAHTYAFPIIRLADIYLMYAEALNEVKDAPDAEVYMYIDMIRARTGLKGVVETWDEHAMDSKKNKPLTQDGMREIIQHERLNELAFEGARFWDLRRWKLAEKYMNLPIRGLNVNGSNAADFYQETILFTPTFELKDYFWPLRSTTMLYNLNMMQSPGWE